MVKINDSNNNSYFSTTFKGDNSVTPQVTPNNSGLSNLNKQDSVNVQHLQQIQNQVAKEAAQKEEADFQSKSILSKLDGQVSDMAVKTVGTLISIDEKNRQQKEEDVAKSYLLNKKVDLQLGYQQFYSEAVKNSGKYGENLVPQVHKWVNNQLLQIENQAPNEAAKAMMQEWAANFKVSTIGSAIKEKENINNDAIKSDVQNTIENLMKMGNATPDMLDNLTPTLKSAGLTDSEASDYINKSKGKLLQSNMTNVLLSGNIQLFKSALQSEDVKKYLPMETQQQFLKQGLDLELKLGKEQLKSQFSGEQQQKYINGKLTLAEFNQNETQEALNNYAYSQAQMLKEKFGNSPAIYSEGLFDLFTKNPDMPIKAYSNIANNAISSKDPNISIPAAYTITRIAQDNKYGNVYSSFNDQTKIDAEALVTFAKTMDFQSAVETLSKMKSQTPANEKQIQIDLQTLHQNKDSAYIKTASGILNEIGYGNSWLTNDPDPTNTMNIESDYNNKFNTFYKIYRDVGLAEQAALKSIKAEYKPETFNSNTLIRQPDIANPGRFVEKELGDSLDKYGPSQFFVPNQFPAIKNYIKDHLQSQEHLSGLDIDLDKNWIYDPKTKLNTPFKVISIPGVTEMQLDDSSKVASFYIVNALPNHDWEVIDTVDVPKTVAEQEQIKFYEDYKNGQKKLSEKITRDWGSIAGEIASSVEGGDSGPTKQ